MQVSNASRKAWALILLQIGLVVSGVQVATGQIAGEPDGLIVHAPSPGQSFERNLGQWNSRALYKVHASDFEGFITKDSLVAVLSTFDTTGQDLETLESGQPELVSRSSVHLTFQNANLNAKVEALGRQEYHTNYFVGPSATWRSDVPHFDQILVKDLYPGIDLSYYFTDNGSLKYDFLVNPGANPAQIKIGIRGAITSAVNTDGTLTIRTLTETLTLGEPKTYQTLGIGSTEVSNRFALLGTELRFIVGSYDRSRVLVIDPLVYSTYIGGNADQAGDAGLVLDGDGNAIVAGYTTSTDYPVTAGAFDLSSNGLKEAVVTKLNAAGTALLFSTYLGGGSDDEANGIAVDQTGYLYLTGQTRSTNYPVTSGVFQPTKNSGSTSDDAFVTKLNPSGNQLAYSSYLGGSNVDVAHAIAVDLAGNAYVSGLVQSSGFATTGAYDTSLGGTRDAFVTKVNPTATSRVYSTYLGGTAFDAARAIAVDQSGNVYVGGDTSSTNFPTTAGAYQLLSGGGSDAFVTMVNAAGTGVSYSTYLGGTSSENTRSLAVDASGNAFAAGTTSSTNFPTTVGAYQTTIGGGQDGFVLQLNPLGMGLVYGSYLGGSASDSINGLALDSLGYPLLVGNSQSLDYPVTVDAYQGTHTGSSNDVIVTKLDPNGATLVYSTFLGGSLSDVGHEGGIAIDAADNAVLTGETFSFDFPTTSGAYRTFKSGSSADVFVTLIDIPALGEPPQLAPRNPGVSAGPGSGQITFSWQVPADYAEARIFTYNVYRSENPGGPFTAIGTSPRGTLFYTDNGRTLGTEYHYYVTAANEYGESPPSAVVIGRSDSVPGPPRLLTAEAAGDVTLRWRAPLSTGGHELTDYLVYSSTDGAAFTLVASVPPASTSYTSPSCDPQCHYRVTATNPVGESLPSNHASLLAGFEILPLENIRGNTPSAGTGFKQPFACNQQPTSINLATGQFMSSICLLRAPSPVGLDIEVVATHRSHSNLNTIAGQGWDLSVLRRIDTDGDDALLLDGAGREDRFTWDAVAGDYTSPPGLYADLNKLPSGSFELQHTGGNRETFAANGQRTEIRDAPGNVVQFSYDLQGRPLEIRDATGRSISFQYNALGLAAINDFAGRSVALEIDAAGDLVSLTPQASKPTLRHQFAYSANHDVLSARDPEERVYLTNTYDDQGRVQAQNNGLGTTTIAYEPETLASTITDPNGNRVTWQYNANLVATSKTEWMDRNVRANDQPSYVTTYQNNAQGDLTLIVWPDGRRSEWTYADASASPLAGGNVMEAREVPTGESSPAKEWTYTYESTYHLPRTVTAPLGNDASYSPPNGGTNSPGRHTTTFWYGHDEATAGDLNADGTVGDAPARTVRIVHPTNNPDGAPHPALASGSQQRISLAEYNARGQVVRAVEPDGAVTAYDYYEVSEASATRPLFHVQSVQRLSERDAPPGGASSLSAMAGGESSTFSSGLVPLPEQPVPSPLQTVPSTITSSVQTIEETGDAMLGSGFTAMSFSGLDGPIESFEYDEAGNLAVATDPNGGNSTWAYDDLGRIVTMRSPGEGVGMNYSYDGSGNLVQVDRLNSVQLPNGTFVPDPTRPTLSDKYTYNAAGQVTESRHDATLPGSTATTESVEQFVYDAGGQLTVHRRHGAVTGDDPNDLTTYIYDERGLLVSATEGGQSPLFEGDATADEPFTLYLHASASQVEECPPNASLNESSACASGPAGACPGGSAGSPIHDRAVCLPPTRFPNADPGMVHAGDLPTGVQGTTMVWDATRGKAYIFGGNKGGTTPSDSIVSYDPETRTSTVVAHMPNGRWFGSAAFDGRYAYYVGGCLDGCTTLLADDIVRFDAVTQSVDVVADLPYPLRASAAVWDGSQLLIFGGCAGAPPCASSKNIISYDPGTGSVSILATKMPRTHIYLSAIWTGQEAIMFSGSGAGTNEIVHFNPATGSILTATAKLPHGVEQASATWDGEHAFIFGGYKGPGQLHTDILRYTPSEGEVVTMTQAMPQPSYRSSSAWMLDSALVHLGWADGYSSKLYSFQPTIAAPSEPYDLVATPGPIPGANTIQWQAPNSTGSTSILSYKVHRAPAANGPFEIIGTSPGNERHFVDYTPGETGATSYYAVSAVNGDLEGNKSAAAFIVNALPLPVTGPVELCPGEGVGLIVADNPACLPIGSCPTGSIGGILPATAPLAQPTPVCVFVFGCPAGTVGMIVNDQATCQNVEALCGDPCPFEGQVICYLPSCTYIVPGLLATHISADGLGAQIELPVGEQPPIVIYVPLGGLPYNPEVPTVDTDPEPPEEPEEPVQEPRWLWIFHMNTSSPPAEDVKGAPNADTAPARISWEWAPADGYSFDGERVQLVFWAIRDNISTDPSSRWNARLYSDDELVASTDPANGVTFTVAPGDAPREYRIDFGKPTLVGERLRVEVDLDSAPGGRLLLFDSVAMPSRLEIGNPETRTTEYDAGGRPTVVTDASGAQTVYEYDDYGQVVSVTDPVGTQQTSTHDPAGRVTATEAYGLLDTSDSDAEPVLLERSIVHHDEAGRIYRVDRAFFDPATGAALPDGPLIPGDGFVSTLFDYDEAGRIVGTIDDNGDATRYTYDGLGRLIATEDALGNQVFSTFDANGNLVEHTEVDVDANGELMSPRTTRLAYDELDQLVRTIDPLGRVQRFGYDSRANLAWQTDARNPTTVPDPLFGGNVNDHGNRIDYQYDAMDRLISTSRELRQDGVGNGALLGHVNTTQEWNGNGQLVRQTDDTGSNTTYEYDTFGRLTRTVFADGTNETYTYDARGLLTAKADANGNVIAQAHDAGGRLLSRTSTGPSLGVSQSFDYDGLGRIVRANDGLHELRFAYDSLGNRVLEAQGQFIAASSFDGVGNALTLSYPSGRLVDREFDALGRLEEVSDTSDILASFTYEGGRMASRTAGNGVTSTFAYDAAQQLAQIDHALPALTLPLRFGYSHDGNGNRVEEWLHHAPEWSKQASYDSLGRLTSFTRGNAASLPSVPNPLDGILPTQTTWTLDGANEWDQVERTLDGTTATEIRSHDSMHAVESITVGSEVAAYDSDANGNRLSDPQFKYTWDGLNRLREVHDAATDELVASYAYDAFARRVEKVADGQTTRYLYDGTDVIEERDGTGALLRQFVHGQATDQPILMDAAAGRLYYLQDALGSVVGLMDNTGNLVEGYLYDAYGHTVAVQPGPTGEVTWSSHDVVGVGSALGNPYGFTGQRLDAETGLYYYRARYYDPDVGSFLSRDPIGVWGDETNLGNGYGYVGNNPLLGTDPTGEFNFMGLLQSLLSFTTGFTKRFVGGLTITRGRMSPPRLGPSQLAATTMARPRGMPNVGRAVDNACTNWGGGWAVGWDPISSAVCGTRQAGKCDGLGCRGQEIAITLVDSAPFGPPVPIRKADDVIQGIGKKLRHGDEGAKAVSAAGKIKITDDAMKHVIARHTVRGADSQGASVFNEGEDLRDLILKAGKTNPVPAQRNRLAYLADAGRPVGWDSVSNSHTSQYTVITEANGELVTAYPGRPRA